MARLILVLGPTASGKTSRAIQLAQQYHTHILSVDSRQFYSELDIGVARPTPEELAAAPHHFIACRSIHEPYNVYSFEQDALTLLDSLFQTHDTVIAVGGSSLYIQALCKGIAPLPDPTPELRQQLKQQLHDEGIQSLRSLLQKLDPEYYARVDLANPARIQRALEVCITAGKPYSQLLDQPTRPRNFAIEPVIITRSREELRTRINDRVRQMFSDGLEEEARQLFPLRNLTPLNTVGYKEFFALWEATSHPPLPAPLTSAQRQETIDAISLNTWHYAKKQLTWLKNAPIYNF